MSSAGEAFLISPEWEDLEWQKQGSCNDGTGKNVRLFFSMDPEEVAMAKALCFECVIRQQCLNFAKETRQPGGVWGGEYFTTKGIKSGPPKNGHNSKQMANS